MHPSGKLQRRYLRNNLWCCLWSAHRLEIIKIWFDGQHFSRLIISLILFGAAGKWTAEYWSGEVLYDIYFVDRDFGFSITHEKYAADELQEIAKWYSRQVVLVETVSGILWALPARWAAALGVIIFSESSSFQTYLPQSLLACSGLPVLDFCP